MLVIMLRILVIVVFLVIIIYGITFSVASKEAAERQLDESTETIAVCRQNRYNILGRIISQLSAPGVSSETLQKLYGLYPQANTEEREINWEMKYIPAVQSYMKKCQNGLTGPALEKWFELNSQLEENEEILTTARGMYNSATDTLERWESKPFCYVITAGEKLKGFFRKADAVKTRKSNEQPAPEHPSYTYQVPQNEAPGHDENAPQA